MKFSRRPILLVLILAAALLAACSSANPTPVATPGAAERSTLAQGRLLPLNSLDLTFNASGRVAEVLVSAGETVQAGQVLAVLEVAAPEARQAELARAELEKQAALTEQAAAAAEALNAGQALDALTAGGAVSVAQLRFNITDLSRQIELANSQIEGENNRAAPDELIVARLQAQLDLLMAQQKKAEADLAAYDNQNLPVELKAAAEARLKAAQQRQETAEIRLKSAEAGLIAALASLKGAELLAPWDGVLAAISLKPGAWVTVGQPVAALADFSAWVVETDNLTEIGVVGIEPGQTVQVFFDALPELELSGTVESVAAQFVEKRGDVTYTVRIRLDATDPALRWGMTTAVRFVK